jgi:hypothetical protein
MRIIDGTILREIKVHRKARHTAPGGKNIQKFLPILVPAAVILYIAILLSPAVAEIVTGLAYLSFFAGAFYVLLNPMKIFGGSGEQCQQLAAELFGGRVPISVNGDHIRIKPLARTKIDSVGYITITNEGANGYEIRYLPLQTENLRNSTTQEVHVPASIVMTEDVVIIPAITVKNCIFAIVPRIDRAYLKVKQKTTIKAGEQDTLTISQQGKNVEVIYRFFKTDGYKLAFIPKIPYYATNNIVTEILSWIGKEIDVHKSRTIPYIQLKVESGKVNEPAIIVYPSLLSTIRIRGSSLPSPKQLLKTVSGSSKPVILGEGVLKATINIPNGIDKTGYVPARFVMEQSEYSELESLPK